MGANKNQNKSIHLGSFWPIVAIAVVGIIAGMAIYFTAYNSQLEDDIYSHFSSLRRNR